MKRFQSWCLAVVAAASLVACGGGDADKNTSPYGKMVVFGDSLSDSGTHATQGVVLGKAGGKYTVNGLGVKIWPELLAAELGVPALCAAKVGLEATNGPAPFEEAAKLAQVPVAVPGCYNYAQGGSRVTNPIGPANKALLPANPSGHLGQLTEPLTTQIAAHLAAATSFAADDLVTVLFGGNDVIMNLAAVQGGLETPTEAGQAMGLAGAQLAGIVKAQMVAKGAKRVVVVNLPAFEVTPAFLELIAASPQPPATAQLVVGMVTAFNTQLQAGLAGSAEVLLIDSYTLIKDFAANPSKYGLSNVKDRACDRTKAATSLLCNDSTDPKTMTVIPGDISHYAFADDVHPTPYAHGLLEGLVLDALVKKGWR